VQIIYTPSRSNTIFQKKLKINYIERKYNKALFDFKNKKGKNDFENLLNTYTEKVDYLIKNVKKGIFIF
jgi:hypothetical protein